MLDIMNFIFPFTEGCECLCLFREDCSAKENENMVIISVSQPFFYRDHYCFLLLLKFPFFKSKTWNRQLCGSNDYFFLKKSLFVLPSGENG